LPFREFKYPQPGKDTLRPIKYPEPIIEGSIHIWTAQLDTWKPHTQKLRDLLSDQEIKRLDRLKIHSKKDEFLSSRGILRIILSLYTGKDPDRIKLGSTSAGKPILPGSPIEFNVSHSRDMFICGISVKSKIGLDIQEVYSISSLDKIVSNYLSPAEYQYLENLQSSDMRQDHFFAIWTAKEAYLKAVGDGIKENFNQVSLIPDSADLRTFHLSLPESTREEINWKIKSIDFGQGYVGALAYHGDKKKMVRYEIDPEFLI